MNPTWRKKIKDEMDLRGINPKELSRAVGRNERLIYDLLSTTDNPRVDTLEAVAHALGHDLQWLLLDSAQTAHTIPILGCVSAGDGWMIYTDGLDEITMETSPGEAIAVEVKGDSMAPIYRNGEVLIGVKRMGETINRLIGLDCIIETDVDARYVKFLQRGTMRGRFNLRSYNPVNVDIENVRVRWAAPIEWVRRLQR